MSVLFALTLFMSAGLLFLVEPMIAKMILPLLGGTPAVWNTCMMFFQALLLAGYIYAHVASTRLSVSTQTVVHVTILVIGLLVLPISVSREWIPISQSHPVTVVLVLLCFSVGLPFFVLSAGAPLLQRWFSRTGHPEAADPYFLYSASNLGSMVALASYPALIEPGLTLGQQSSAWTAGYSVLVLLSLGCAILTWRSAGGARKPAASHPDSADISLPADGESYRLRVPQQMRWVVLSFVPSSLLLGVTTFLTTDVAAIPLFWIVPLALYLLTFVLVFSRIPSSVHQTMIHLFPVAVVVLLFVNVPLTKPPTWITFLLNLITFFIVGMVCHGELARSRPPTDRLTEFYLLMSAGGFLGGVFNALIAPLLFKTVAEYPLALVLASLLLPNPDKKADRTQRGRLFSSLALGFSLLLGPLTFWLMVEKPLPGINLLWLSGVSGIEPEDLRNVMTFSIPAVLCYGLVFVARPHFFGIGVGAVVAAIMLANSWNEEIVYRDRSFFGVIKVRDDPDQGYRYLIHGTTQHGTQSLDPARSREALSYYHREGPVGQLFTEFSGPCRKERVAVVGLGTGTLASYGEPGQHFTFYEIDPLVKNVATDPSLFSYLKDSLARWEIVLGDARLKLEEAPDHHYGLMVIDAFSSDAIPVHLLTRQAVRLYFSKLEGTGLVALHISNRHLDLGPVVECLARDAGLLIRTWDDPVESAPGKTRSHWVLMARAEADFGRLAYDSRWERPKGEPGGPVWTDDYSNLLKVFRWSRNSGRTARNVKG